MRSATGPDFARRPLARWVAAPPPPASSVSALVDALLLPETVCHLLASRGYEDPELAKRFLRPRLEQLESPWLMHDARRAVDRIASAVKSGETIFVHGDYDVDGMCSTAILTRVLHGLGAHRVVPFVPSRLTDGYDLGAAGVAAARDSMASLVITCDCGTSAHESVRTLMQSGVDVIVTDHHLPGESLPPAYALVNPRHPMCGSTDKNLSGAGVAYKLALGLCEELGVSPGIAHRELDLVALATIADVVPLRGENRVLVRYGLRLLSEDPHPGLRALIRSSGLESKTLTAGRVGFVLAPRLNAAGRIADAKLGLQLLLSEREEEANALARELEELNRERQELDRSVLDEALRQLDQPGVGDRYGLVLSSRCWHAGVIGIVASRIVEQTARPAVLVAVDGGIGKGSGRSIKAFDLHAGLSRCSDLFDRFGGHRSAAGLTMQEERLPEFVERFDEVARSQLTPDDLVPELRIDLEIPVSAVDERLEQLVRYFEPFGMGNPAPVFRAENVRLAGRSRRIGADGVRLAIETPTGILNGIGWGLAASTGRLDEAGSYQMVFRIERDDYRGNSELQLRVSDIRVTPEAE